VAGPTHDRELPVGKHPLQLYSLATPNGVKVTVMLEELLAAGHGGAEYDAWLINIRDGDQFGSGYVSRQSGGTTNRSQGTVRIIPAPKTR
jgi:GST-like protein